ncbi:MAG: hypothetical protein GWO24_22460, partial [Akkermansiaceae bacterium]|nr:hypothetical protein [Akkermansiaceae bacterium]
MLIGFPCPYCNAKLEVEAKEAGSTVPCPACNKPVIIPRKTLGVGSTIGDFKLKKLIGAGGMGQVYLARQLSMDR